MSSRDNLTLGVEYLVKEGSRRRANQLSRKRYKELIARLEVDQNGRCAICNTLPPDNTPLFLDHDHKTLVIRGLLCLPCNTGLGMFKDEPKLLARAIVYLEDYTE